MKKYLIYKHTIKHTGKSYIGFTSSTLEKRLIKHLQNANSGIKSKFYNALNKYGPDSLESEVIAYCEAETEALDLEEHYINYYDTYRNGYNSTKRGGGGWIIGQLSLEAQESYWEKRKLLTTGEKNPRFSGYTDQEIAEAGARFYLENNNIFNISGWFKYSKDNGNFPKTFSKCRFNGEGFEGFKKAICTFLGVDKLNYYKKTEEHNKKIAESQKNLVWINNGKKHLRIKKQEINNYDPEIWKRGSLKIK